MSSVWYIGRSDERTITSGQWDAAGLPHATTTWNKANGWSIPAADFTAPQLALLNTQTAFNTTAPDGPRPGSVIVPSDPLEDLVKRSQLIDAMVDELETGPFNQAVLALLDDVAVPHSYAGNWPVFVYGNSYTLLNLYTAAGTHYTEQMAAKLEAGALTSYGVGGTRIVDVLSGMVNGSPVSGAVGQLAGALWPGSSRQGLVIIDASVNDTGHYPSHVGTAVPADITSANTRYLDGLKGMYRAALALASSGSRVEQTAATFTGTWSAETATPYASGGFLRFTSTVGAKAAFTVTPPQYGPMAGKVFFLTYKLDAAVGAMAQMTIDVDGTNSFNHTPTAWEQYAGPSGVNINVAWECISVTVPVDGASHVVNITHSGSAGQFLYADAIIVPSADPNPVAVMGGEVPIGTGVWNATQVATFRRNTQKVATAVKAVVAEFPHAVYAPSTMQGAAFVSDGIHPNLVGMTQRATDLVEAMDNKFRARLRNRAIALGI